jgi:hypothetical protein
MQNFKHVYYATHYNIDIQVRKWLDQLSNKHDFFSAFDEWSICSSHDTKPSPQELVILHFKNPHHWVITIYSKRDPLFSYLYYQNLYIFKWDLSCLKKIKLFMSTKYIDLIINRFGIIMT